MEFRLNNIYISTLYVSGSKSAQSSFVGFLNEDPHDDCVGLEGASNVPMGGDKGDVKLTGWSKACGWGGASGKL